ncbi:MAG TPA: phosphoglycerate mutase family protein, partial [Gaiellaceae bacterium]
MTVLLVRHAWAGERSEWKGDDHLRPLDERGRAQAEDLIAVLERFPVEAIMTSPYLRCVQTLEPLAAARGLAIEQREELGEEQQFVAGAALVRSVAGRAVVACGHGGLEQAVLTDAPKWKKGATLVLGPQLELLET